jgi:serine phosphatase RsbU (regulator of sigma subunit)
VVNLYLVRKHTIDTFLGGDLLPFNARLFRNKNFQFPIVLQPKDTIEVFLNVQNSGEQFHVPLVLARNEIIENKASNEQIIYGIYFGFILFVLLINLFYLIVLKDNSSIFYVGYLVCLLGLQLSLTGFGFEYLWPQSIYLANHANPIFSSISILFLIRFVQSFLNVNDYLPRVNKGIRIIWLLMLSAAAMSFVEHNLAYRYSVLVINACSLILSIIIIPISFFILRKKYKPARFFFFAFIVLLLSVFMFVLKNAGIVSSNFLSDYGLQLGSALEVLLLTLALIDRFNEFKQEALTRLQEVNQLKTQANLALEIKVEERTQQINDQKIQLEIQNEEIISSIKYAERIQRAVLPSNELIQEIFKQNAFVFYQPKDIVSGDFYWISKSNTHPNKIYVAVVDCTGHGVPGAFMSMLGHTYLKQAIRENETQSVNHILNALNSRVRQSLNQQDQDGFSVQDGMDVSLISIDYETNTLEFAGANNGVLIVKNNGELIELKPDKQAIGSGLREVKPFQVQSIELNKGDYIYMYTDGFADQFGGTANKKFYMKNLRVLATKLAQLPVYAQYQTLQKTFIDWKGDMEQTDDVCVIGIRFE